MLVHVITGHTTDPTALRRQLELWRRQLELWRRDEEITDIDLPDPLLD